MKPGFYFYFSLSKWVQKVLELIQLIASATRGETGSNGSS